MSCNSFAFLSVSSFSSYAALCVKKTFYSMDPQKFYFELNQIFATLKFLNELIRVIY